MWNNKFISLHLLKGSQCSQCKGCNQKFHSCQGRICTRKTRNHSVILPGIIRRCESNDIFKMNEECWRFCIFNLAKRKDMDTELQQLSIPSQEQGFNATYRNTLVGDRRQEYGKRYHTTLYVSSNPYQYKCRFHSLSNSSFKPINFNLTST